MTEWETFLVVEDPNGAGLDAKVLLKVRSTYSSTPTGDYHSYFGWHIEGWRCFARSRKKGKPLNDGDEIAPTLTGHDQARSSRRRPAFAAAHDIGVPKHVLLNAVTVQVDLAAGNLPITRLL